MTVHSFSLSVTNILPPPRLGMTHRLPKVTEVNIDLETKGITLDGDNIPCLGMTQLAMLPSPTIVFPGCEV